MNLSIYIQVIDPNAFAGIDAFKNEMSFLYNECVNNPPIDKNNKVRMPGQNALMSRKKSIENGIEDLKKSLKGTDVEDIKKKTQNLIQVSMKLGEAVYKSQKKPDDKDKGTGGPKDTKPNEKDNVVDADFEDVKEDKEKSA